MAYLVSQFLNWKLCLVTGDGQFRLQNSPLLGVLTWCTFIDCFQLSLPVLFLSPSSSDLNSPVPIPMHSPTPSPPKRSIYFFFPERFIYLPCLSPHCSQTSLFLVSFDLWIVALLSFPLQLWVSTYHVCLYWVWVTSLKMILSSSLYLSANFMMLFFNSWVILNFVNVPHSVYSLFSWRTSKLFPFSSYYE